MNLHLSFHTILILVYTIPNIYVFTRIWHLFVAREFRSWYVIIYLLLAMIYPASNLLSERVSGYLNLTFLADYLLPLFLYLFLFILVFDILLLVNRLFKFIPAVELKNSRFRKTSLISILLLSVTVVIGGVINFNTIRTSDYRVEIPRRLSTLTHLRIAFTADFHLQERTGIFFVKRFAEKMKAIKPDIMIFGGDIVEGDSDDGNIQEYESILRGIQTRYGVFTVLGNHEYYARQDKGSFFNQAGMKVLGDTFVVIDSSFILAGRYDSHFRGRKSVYDLLRTSSDSLPLILVDHRPTEIDQVSSTKVDVQLSGHTHNGQMFPINLITRKVYQLSWGYLKKGNTHFFVTSGIQLWGPPVRTTGKSEIMVIDLDFIP
jgi:predicted MPP superfamily phosphohydrolase